MSATITLSIMIIFSAEIEGLGSRDWRTREACHRQLASWGYAAWPSLEQGSKRSDPEIRIRCQQLTQELRRGWAWELAGNYLPSGWKRLPWIHLYEYEMVNHYLDMAERRGAVAISKDGKDYPRWRLATRFWIADKIMAGWRDMEIISDLEVMAREETEWKRMYQRD